MSDIIVAFHVGRGGRFYNAGHKSFIGEKSIGEFTEDLYTRFENESRFTDRLGWDESFDGVKCILDCLTDEDFDTLETSYGINQEDLGELEYYSGSSGASVGLTQKDVDSGIGIINIDHGYNTTYTKFVSDCDEEELELIREYTGWKSQDLEEYVNPKWVIQDWAGNRMFPEEEFDSYEAGWEFIYEHIQEEEEGDGTYDDVYVILKN